jgi:hypothetical protein
MVVGWLVVLMRLPAVYPLRPIEVEAVNTAGLSEAEWRRVLLSMTITLNNQVG